MFGWEGQSIDGEALFHLDGFLCEVSLRIRCGTGLW